jgi:ribosome-associated protein
VKTAAGATDAAKESKTRQFAIEAARLAANTRCHNVVLLDVRGISPVTDYMVLATGTSPRQMRTVCDDLAEMAQEQHGEHPLSEDVDQSENWMLIDFVDVVLHVFSQDARQFYDLDSLWGDAKVVDWNAAGDAAASSTR